MKSVVNAFSCVFVLLFFASLAVGATIYVPSDYGTIQGAIDNASDGDLILVSAGTYTENIDYDSKMLTIRSENGANYTTINGGMSGPVVTFGDNGSGSVLNGFTITNGSGLSDGLGTTYGGGILCYDSSPTIKNNVITSNSARYGAGIFIQIYDPENTCAPTIERNEITLNLGTGSAPKGGGICCWYANATIKNNLISRNDDVAYGGGIHIRGDANTATGPATIYRNTITYNEATYCGGGICTGNYSKTVIDENNIISNVAAEGGGIYSAGTNSIGEDEQITDNWIESNSAEQGGGVCIVDGTAYTNNVTFVNNRLVSNNSTSSASGGGGIYIYDCSPVVTNNGCDFLSMHSHAPRRMRY